MFTKKKEFTRVECFTLSIAQWCVLELLPGPLKGKNVFFSEISLYNIPIRKLETEFYIGYNRQHRAIKIRVHFSVLPEVFPSKKNNQFRPTIEGELLFQNIGMNGTIVWEISALKIEVRNCKEIQDCPSVRYGMMFPYNDKGGEQEQRAKRFKAFFKELLFCSIGE